MEKLSKINENIRYIREKNKLSQSEFGSIIDKGASLVSAYEKGVSIPPLNIILIIAEKFNYYIDELFSNNLNEIDNEVNIHNDKYYTNVSDRMLGGVTVRKEDIREDLNLSKNIREIIQLWEWIENTFINIINLNSLIDEELFEKYEFLSDTRNKYMDEKVLFYTGKKPYIEKEYLGELIDIKNISYEELLSYKEDLSKNYNKFLDIMNSMISKLMKRHYAKN